MQLLLLAALACAAADEVDAHLRRHAVYVVSGFFLTAHVVSESADRWTELVADALVSIRAAGRG